MIKDYDSTAHQALEHALAGERLSGEQGVALFHADLLALGAAANELCHRRHGDSPRTYVIDRNINYTNICQAGCRFCAFWRTAGAPDAYLLSHSEILEKVVGAEQQGATQILLQGGLHPQLEIEWFEELFHIIKSASRVHLHSLSPPEIVHLAHRSGLSFTEVLRRLQEAGLDSLPGGGAEILNDEVRAQVSPHKCTTGEWFAVMRAAHALGLPTTATMMLGHLETFTHRVEHLLRLRQLQDETRGFTAIIPWTYQPGNTALGGEEVGAHDYLRTLAIARILLDNFDHLQTSWVTQGPKIAQLALTFGADDLGAVMLEENVVRAAGANYSLTEQELIRLIEDLGYRAARRDTYYHLLQAE